MVVQFHVQFHADYFLSSLILKSHLIRVKKTHL